MAGRIGFAPHAMVLAYAGLALLVYTPAALAQDPLDAPVIPDEPGKLESKKPDIEHGNRLARTLCTTCHLIGEPTEHPVPADVPSFIGIANRQGQTLDQRLVRVVQQQTGGLEDDPGTRGQCPGWVR